MASRSPDAAVATAVEDPPREPASALQAETAAAIAAWVVRNDLPAGHHLKEHDLCEVFGLSRSPIRAALTLLAGDGVVERRPSKGFFLLVSGWELGERESGRAASASDELYRTIAEAWFVGAIPPQPSTAELVRRFGGGPGDVGRALRRLATDGVILRTAGKGWRLGPNLATPEAFADSYLFRLTIEPAAILLPTFALSRPMATRSRRRHERILGAGSQASIREMVDADLEFHGLIAASCGNQFFAQGIERQNTLRRLTEMMSTTDGQRLQASCAEHLGILGALEDNRREVAAALMREHLTISRGFTPAFAEGPP